MSPVIQAKFSHQQRDAVIAAYDRGIRPLARIPRMAEGGELTLHGVPVPPFTVAYATARGWVKTAEKRRRKARVDLEPEDAIEQLRGQLIDAVALGIQRFEREARKGEADYELARQIARAMREIKAIPPREKRGVTPGQRGNGQKEGGETVGGLAGSILKAARSNGTGTAPERPSVQEAPAENANSGTATAQDTEEDGEQREDGSRERAPVSRYRLLG